MIARSASDSRGFLEDGRGITTSGSSLVILRHISLLSGSPGTIAAVPSLALVASSLTSSLRSASRAFAVRSMALEAAVREDRPNVAVESHAFRARSGRSRIGPAACSGGRDRREQDQRPEPRVRTDHRNDRSTGATRALCNRREEASLRVGRRPASSSRLDVHPADRLSPGGLSGKLGLRTVGVSAFEGQTLYLQAFFLDPVRTSGVFDDECDLDGDALSPTHGGRRPRIHG